MSRLRVVWGTATGPTAMASYDAALADANVHEYNLVSVSSVIPAEPPLDVVGTAPDLGATGNRLTVVQSRETLAPAGAGGDGDAGSADGHHTAVAAVGWARSEAGPGIFYEASGHDEALVRETVQDGLTAGVDLRDWDPVEEDVFVRSVDAAPGAHATVVVLATYGTSTPLC